MPVSKEEFQALEIHDIFYGFRRDRMPVVTSITRKGDQKIVFIKWDEKGIPCLWNDILGKVTTLDGTANYDVEELNERAARAYPEDVRILTKKWLDAGKITPDDAKRLMRAEDVTSDHVIGLMI